MLTLVMAALAFGAAPPESLGKITLGSRPAVYDVDVPNCAVFGARLASMRVRMVSGSARIGRIFVTYADRAKLALLINKDFRNGEGTDWLDLGVHGRGDDRCVAILRLEAKPLQNGAEVEVFGTKETH